MPIADADVALLAQRVVGEIVGLEEGVDVAVGPVGDGVDLGAGPLGGREGDFGAGVGLAAAQAGEPGVGA